MGPVKNFLCLLCLFMAVPLFATDLRLVGTNLYDFATADAKSGYRVQGTLSKIYPQSIEVTIQCGIGYQRFKFGTDSLYAISDADKIYLSHLPEAEQQEVVDEIYSNYFNPPPISDSQYAALGSTMKQNYKPVALYSEVFLLNYSSLATIGNTWIAPSSPRKIKAFMTVAHHSWATPINSRIFM
jgi:hypothetical protein